jgi:asparagine synthase (glutamine-hydrolysing)
VNWLCGFFAEAPPEVAAARLAAMAATAPPAATGLASHAGSSAGAAARWVSVADGVLVALSGWPYWADRGAAPPPEDLATHLARRYRQDGARVLDGLRGAFTLAIYDTAARSGLLAIDRIGQHHLYYARVGEALAFGSSADAVLAFPGVARELSHDALFQYLYFHMIPSPGTVYGAVSKLEGAHCLLFRPGRVEVRPYWRPTFVETWDRRDQRGLAPSIRDQRSQTPLIREAGEELLALLQTDVARYCDVPGVGAFLSGGLDSSTVAGLLARVRPSEAHTYSVGFAEERYNELPYAHISAEWFRTTQHDVIVSPDDALTAVATVAAALDEPFGNSSALAAYFCAKAAREDGVTRLIAGDGGDEIFAGNERYAKQLVFEAYFRLPAALRAGLIEPLLLGVPALERVPLVKKGVSYVRQALVRLPDRFDTYSYLNRHPLAEIFQPEFLASVDTAAPSRAMQALWEAVPEASTVNRMLFLDWKKTLQDNDLVKVNRMAEAAGIEVVYPMLDDAVVELSCRVPSRLKLKPGRLRYFYKEAMRGFLPPQTLTKKKHGFGLPFAVWITSHRPLQEMAYDSVLALRTRHYLRPEFLEKAIHLHRHDTAIYYGELLWILMMLEQWFESRKL